MSNIDKSRGLTVQELKDILDKIEDPENTYVGVCDEGLANHNMICKKVSLCSDKKYEDNDCLALFVDPEESTGYETETYYIQK